MNTTQQTPAADLAERTADQMLDRADAALDQLADQVDQARDHAVPRLQQMAASAEALVRNSAAALRDRSEAARLQARRASEHTVEYIRDEPVKSVLIAAATGAAMVAAASLWMRSR